MLEGVPSTYHVKYVSKCSLSSLPNQQEVRHREAIPHSFSGIAQLEQGHTAPRALAFESPHSELAHRKPVRFAEATLLYLAAAERQGYVGWTHS